MATALTSSQPRVAQLERQPDMHVSTLRGYVAAAGWTLRLTAEHNGQVIELDLGERR
jgi:hypothetical protein